jgi:hypothetical protein
MWDLDTIVRLNSANATAPAPKPAQQLRIYDLGNNKFALGNKGERAQYVVRRVANKVDALGRGLPTYKGVQARRPRIPADARLISRSDAGRLLLRALGLR